MFHKLFKESENLQFILSQDLKEVLAVNDNAIQFLGLDLEELNEQVPSNIINELEKKYPLVHSSFRFNEETLFHLQFSIQKKEIAEMEIIYKSLHDLKQPVSIIGSFSQLLERKLKSENKLDEKELSFLKYIDQGIHRLNYLMKSLAEYARFQNPIEKHPYSFKEILAQLHLANQKSFDELNVDFQSHINIDTIEGDKEQIIILLQKVIENSLRFRHKERDPKIVLNVQEMDSKVLISISDNGIGIEEEHQSKIFDIYTKFYENEEQKSSGLGLALAKQIVSNHNGRIWIESTKGIGTTMFIRI